MSFRIESDSMGEMNIPSEFLYGASTQRAVENFTVSSRKFNRQFIEALGLLKWAAATANQELGLLDKKRATVISKHALDVAEGQYDKHFVVDLYQTGSGTSTNMNANEVIAHLSGKTVHPNDHVNLGQSSNDVIPSSIHVGASLALKNHLIPALKSLEKSLLKKTSLFKDIIKIGRTHLQDATPMTLGQEFSGYASQMSHNIKWLQAALESLRELAIGGTAVGTGINTHPLFAKKVCALLKAKTGISFFEAKNHFEAQGAKDACVFASGALKTLAISLMKIANDLRWLSSGPLTGLNEIHLPDLQPGSSIMPGKVNPVIPEMVMQVSAQVQGNDLAIQIGAGHGNFELNVMMPMIAGNLFESVEILTNAVLLLDEKCVRGITANVKRCEEFVEKSPMLVTALNAVIGYDKAAVIAKKALKEGKTIRHILTQEKILPPDQIKKLLNPKNMLKPH